MYPRTWYLFAIVIIAVPAWSLVDATLDGHGLPSKLFFAESQVTPLTSNQVTYLPHSLVQQPNLRRVVRSSTRARKPDTTIVLLNWSRLQNVIFQASVYCEASLQGVVEQVFVWNNQRNIKLEYDKHFANTNCSPERLRIHNSPSNVYFQARFMGCVDSSSRYCFLQDDDYITLPDILLNVHASFESSERTLKRPSPIILLPPHDHLETDLSGVSVRHLESNGRFLRTSFAWLGHGTYLLRSQAKEYLALLQRMHLNDEEMNLADNYFTLLSGQVPNTWFTHTVELSRDHGTPTFTVGATGNDRNWKHIERAMKYLDEILRLENTETFPHFSPSGSPRQHAAPCIAHPCTVHSNILMLSPRSTSSHAWSRGDRMREVKSRRLNKLGEEGTQWYTDHPLSKAVDGDVKTAFRSAGAAMAGDYFLLTLMSYQSSKQANEDKDRMDLVWLVDSHTASILYLSSKDISRDGITWSPLLTTPLACFSTTLPLPPDFTVVPPSILGPLIGSELPQYPASDGTTVSSGLLECHATFEFETEQDSQTHVRVALDRDLSFGWSIYEVWLRAR